MKEREQIVSGLGDLLFQAARASVAKGAMYEPGESIILTAESVWQQVAETLVRVVEATVDDRIPRDKQDNKAPAKKD